MIDFHSHLDLYPNPRTHARSLSAEVTFVLSVTNSPAAFRGTRTLEPEHPAIHTAVGLHPQLAVQREAEIPLLESLIASHTFVGEIGLDGQSSDTRDREAQMRVFRAALDASVNAGGRILSIHSRRATTAVVGELRTRPEVGAAVLHWFSGTPTELADAIRANCWFSIGPAMIAGAKGRNLAASIPRDRVLTETDGPFASVGDRPAEPSDVRVAEMALAEAWGVEILEVRDQIRKNLKRVLADRV